LFRLITFRLMPGIERKLNIVRSVFQLPVRQTPILLDNDETKNLADHVEKTSPEFCYLIKGIERFVDRFYPPANKEKTPDPAPADGRR
jgi:hypothetical protein